MNDLTPPKMRRVNSLAWDIPLPSGANLRVHYAGEITAADADLARRAMAIMMDTIEMTKADEPPLIKEDAQTTEQS